MNIVVDRLFWKQLDKMTHHSKYFKTQIYINPNFPNFKIYQAN